MGTSNGAGLACLALAVLVACAEPEPRSTSQGAVASPAASAAPAWQLPAPTVAASALPHQEALYDVVTREFVRLGWDFVCIGVVPDTMRPLSGKDSVDPPANAVAWLKSHNTQFRPASDCKQDGEEVLEARSGVQGGVLVTVWGADVEERRTLVRVTWCCWTGWGTLILAPAARGWTLAGTENWLQT